MDLLEPLSQTFDHTTKVIAGVRADQFDAATPCRDWDLRALVTHTLGVVVNMGRGASGAELLVDINAVALEADLGAQFRAEADRTLAAWTRAGRRRRSQHRRRADARAGRHEYRICSTPPPTPGTSPGRLDKTRISPTRSQQRC